MAKRKRGTWDINIEINGKQVKNNLNGVTNSIKSIKKQLRGLRPGTEEFIKKSQELKKARDQYKKINDEINQTNVTLEEAQTSFSNLFAGILSGDIGMIQAGIKGISGNIKGMTKAALGFIATPIGAAIAVLSGVALATKEWINYNEAAKEANILTQEITNLTGQELDDARIKAEALAEVFTKSEFTENLETAKALVKGFGISYDEAFTLIEDSYVRGATANKEFNDSVIEFSAIQEKAGFTAQQTVSIINTAYEQGLYKDKLIDSIKEVDTALTEQTKSTKDALENAFGETFTANLFTGIKTGVISTKDAIALLAKEAETAHLNEQQYAQLTADVFKAAGEDIAGAEKVLSVYNLALNKQAEALTPLQKETKRLTDAHLEMKQAQDDALKSDSYAKFSNDITILWTKTKTFFYNVIGGIVNAFQNWFLMMKLGFSDIVVSFGTIPLKFNETKKLLIKAALQIVGAFNNIGDAWGSLKKLDFTGVKDSFNAFTNSIKNTASTALIEYSSIGAKIDEIQSKARNVIIKNHFDSLTAAGDLQTDNTNTNETTEDENNGIDSITGDSSDLEKHQQKLKDLQLNKEEETELLKTLEAKEGEVISKIKDKYSQQEISQLQKNAKLKQKLQQDVLNGAINVAGRETRVGQALLAVKGMLAAKESLIQLGVLKAKVATNVAGATADIAAGTAKTAKVGFPQNIPLLIGFAAQVGGIISAIKNATKGAKLPGMNDGGDTPNTYFGNDRYGPITSFNHGNEYVVPEIIRADPTYASQINTLEKARTQKLDLPATETANNASPDSNEMLTNAVYMLMAKLDEPIYAKALIGDDEIDRQSTRQTKIANARNNAKIK
jgi:hypothetical protein